MHPEVIDTKKIDPLRLVKAVVPDGPPTGFVLSGRPSVVAKCIDEMLIGKLRIGGKLKAIENEVHFNIYGYQGWLDLVNAGLKTKDWARQHLNQWPDED